jgi:drug/metabolite transporter (DMT)-like permease
MTTTAAGVLLVSLCALIEGFAQLAFKMSASVPARRALWIAAGVALFLVRAVAYSQALRYLNVSIAYAVDALSFVAVTVLSLWLLREHVTTIRWAGVALIMIGIGMIVAQA